MNYLGSLIFIGDAKIQNRRDAALPKHHNPRLTKPENI
jgi:hypothetical protein